MTINPLEGLLENERIDDLQRNGLKIIQKTDGFCFGMDAVLLSGFAHVKRGEKVLDMGTGTGIIPLLLSAKTQGERFTALEIQKEIAEMARKIVSLESVSSIYNADDLNDAERELHAWCSFMEQAHEVLVLTNKCLCEGWKERMCSYSNPGNLENCIAFQVFA